MFVRPKQNDGYKNYHFINWSCICNSEIAPNQDCSIRPTYNAKSVYTSKFSKECVKSEYALNPFLENDLLKSMSENCSLLFFLRLAIKISNFTLSHLPLRKPKNSSIKSRAENDCSV